MSLTRSAVGCLLWLAVSTRPDLSFAVGQVAKFSSAPTLDHWVAVKRIFRYLKGTINLSLTFRCQTPTKFRLLGYSDSDWAGSETRKSTGGFIFKIGDNPICWKSTVHRSICLSSVEAETVFLSKTAQEGKWLIRVIQSMNMGPAVS